MRLSVILTLYAGAILLLSWLASPASAQSSAGTSDYTRAVRLLTAGKDFNQAITLLQAAVRAEPKNADYHLALGCAYADRAASIAYAADWQYHMSDMMSKPAKPPSWFHAYTKDDRKPLELTDAQAKTKVNDLSSSARKEWQQAMRLCETNRERAYAEYVEGWGNWTFGLSTPWNPIVGALPGRAGILKDFQAATRDDPVGAAYWASVGYISTSGVFFGHVDVKDYRRAIELQPRNPALWYTLFQAESAGLRSGHLTAADREDALHAIEECIQQEPTNAFPLYELAYFRLDQTSYRNNAANSADTRTPALVESADKSMEESLTSPDRQVASQVLSEMQKAGGLQVCSRPDYRPPLPPLLSATWGYFTLIRFPDLGSNENLRELARDLRGVAVADAIEHKQAGAVGASRCIIHMGNQLAGTWPVKDSPSGWDQTIEPLVGIAIARIGYDTLVYVEQESGSPAAVKAAKAESAAFKAKVTAYVDQINKHLTTNMYTIY